MSSKHLSAGSPCPPLKDGKIRIYSMKYCPFAHRALLVANAKGIPYDLVNCDLKNKPEFLVERNPQGEVPVVETHDGKVLYESLIVAEYLDEAFPQSRPLHDSDLYKKYLDKLYMDKCRPILGSFFGILVGSRDPSNSDEVIKEKIAKFATHFKAFEEELGRHSTPFFGGDVPGMLDYMLWPVMERLPIVKMKRPDAYDYDEAKRQHPNLENWRQAMKKDPAVAKLFLSPEMHFNFTESMLAGSPVYD